MSRTALIVVKRFFLFELWCYSDHERCLTTYSTGHFAFSRETIKGLVGDMQLINRNQGGFQRPMRTTGERERERALKRERKQETKRGYDGVFSPC